MFSVLAIVMGFSQIVYIPISEGKAFDLTVVAFVFAVLIGGYRVGIPLAIVWSLVSWFNVPDEFIKWTLWEITALRILFGFSLVWFYNLAKRLYHRSPYNVYRAIIAAIVLKGIVGIPSELYHFGWPEAIVLRGEIVLLETALCCVFMSLLIKHLRQIHILNGVKKREKGVKENVN